MKKKLLVLGGKPIGSVEMVLRAQALGYYVIVTDYLNVNESPAKKYADESWQVSTADVNKIAELCREKEVSGVLTAVHEFNINRMRELCNLLNFPCYCESDAWKYCDDKVEFKKMCLASGLLVAKEYHSGVYTKNISEKIDSYPVVVKPVDGSGSRGFSICKSAGELAIGIDNAKKNSPTQRFLVEDFVPYESVIIHYTIINGIAFFCGMSDKKSVKFSNTNAPVMGIQHFPSMGSEVYLKSYDKLVGQMLQEANFQQGPVWIEAFYDGKERFIFNEMGFRFGGSLTYYPVKYFYGIDQLDLLIDSSFNRISTIPVCGNLLSERKNYCILPVHIRPGRINKIIGVDDIKKLDDLIAYVPVHFEGELIEAWGSAQQVFCYLHFTYDSVESQKLIIRKILSTLQAQNAYGENLLYTLFDIETLVC